MKTMKKGDEIIRVSEKDQFEYLKNGYSYVSKSLWKEKVRNIKEKKEKIKENLKKKRKNNN